MFKRKTGSGLVAGLLLFAAPAYSTGPSLPAVATLDSLQAELKITIKETGSQDIVVKRQLLARGQALGKAQVSWTVLVPSEAERLRSLAQRAPALPSRTARMPPVPADAEVGKGSDPSLAPEDATQAALPPGFATREPGTLVAPPPQERLVLADGLYAEEFVLSTLVGSDDQPAELVTYRYFEIKKGARSYLSAEDYSARVEGPLDKLLDTDAKPQLGHRGSTQVYTPEMLRVPLPKADAWLELSGDVREAKPDQSEVNEK